MDLPIVLWRCWLGGRKGTRPVKNWAVRSWCGICLEQGADLHIAQLMPLPLTVSCFSKIQIGFSFLVLAHPGSPGQRAIKRVCVCACVCEFLWIMSIVCGGTLYEDDASKRTLKMALTKILWWILNAVLLFWMQKCFCCFDSDDYVHLSTYSIVAKMYLCFKEN